MNKKQRIEIVARLSTIAVRHGANVTMEEERFGRKRSIYFGAKFPHVNVSIDIDDLHKGGLLSCWYGAKRPLAFGVFDSVNEVHRCKATMYRPDAESFYEAFERACAAIVSGAAFDDSWVKPEMHAIAS